jgi:hypothetical protein
MADLKKALNFYILFESNGTDKNFEVSFATDPIAYVPPESVANTLSALFSALPSDVQIDTLTADLGISGTPTFNPVTKVLSGTFTNAGTDDSLYLLSGTALY